MSAQRLSETDFNAAMPFREPPPRLGQIPPHVDAGRQEIRQQHNLVGAASDAVCGARVDVRFSQLEESGFDNGIRASPQ